MHSNLDLVRDRSFHNRAFLTIWYCELLAQNVGQMPTTQSTDALYLTEVQAGVVRCLNVTTVLLQVAMTLTKQERRARRKKNSECNNSECCSGILSHDDVIPAKQAATSSPLRTLSETHDVIVTREVCCYENGSRYPCVWRHEWLNRAEISRCATQEKYQLCFDASNTSTFWQKQKLVCAPKTCVVQLAFTIVSCP